jgi:hypothetical protein
MNDSDWFLDRMNRYRPSGPVPLPSLGELKVGQHEIHYFSDIEFYNLLLFVISSINICFIDFTIAAEVSIIPHVLKISLT